MHQKDTTIYLYRKDNSQIILYTNKESNSSRQETIKIREKDKDTDKQLKNLNLKLCHYILLRFTNSKLKIKSL